MTSFAVAVAVAVGVAVAIAPGLTIKLAYPCSRPTLVRLSANETNPLGSTILGRLPPSDPLNFW